MKAKILSVALAGLFTASAFAGTSVAVVDLTQVFQNVPQGSSAFNALKQQLAPQVAQLQTQQKTLQQQAASLQANKKLSKTQLASQQAQLSAQSQSLQQSIQNFQQTATQQEQTLLNNFGTSVKAAVNQVAKKEGYDLVLTNQGTLYSTGDIDITNQVITVLKQQAPAASNS